MQHRVLEYYHVCSNNNHRLTLTYFMARSNLVPYVFVWEKGKTMDFFRNCCRLWFETSNRWPKWQEVSVDIKTVSPGGCLPPALGYIHVLKHEKICIKSDFKEIFLIVTNGWKSDKAFLLKSKCCPPGTVCLCPGDTCNKPWKKCIKSDFRDIFFETCNKWTKWLDISVDIKTSSPDCCLPLS